MSELEILNEDVEEILLQSWVKEDIEVKIECANLQSNIEESDFLSIHSFYYKYNLLYIYELPSLKKILLNENLIEKLEDIIKNKDMKNVFLILRYINKETIPKALILLIEKMINSKKEYVNLFNLYIEEEEIKKKEEKIKNIPLENYIS